ncbi:MAG TPA: hypothetical protein VLA93_02995 [Pyrinomonadaceae bacterium]|nr:hypothetical protein [Pyrinomonadaceae bacterium]
MSKNFRILTIAVAIFSLFGAISAVRGQQPITGTWTASVKDNANKIQLTFELRSDRGGRHQSGESYEYSQLQGLSSEQAHAGGAVRFSLVREAGRIDCEGSFQNGKGSGTFTFTGNQSFLAAMKSRGFDFEKQGRGNHPVDLEERLFVATTVNVTTALADDLLASGFPNLDVDDLFKAAIFKIDSQFMREMKATGFNLGMEDLVKARIFKIDPAFVAKATEMGFANESFDSLVKMQIFKVTPEFVAEMRNEGLNNLSVEDVVKLRIFKIDRDFIRQSKADGVPLEVERLVRRRIHAERD